MEGVHEQYAAYGGGAIVQRKQTTDLDGEIQKVKLHGLIGAKGLARTHCEMQVSSMLRKGGCACRTRDSNNEIVLRTHFVRINLHQGGS